MFKKIAEFFIRKERERKLRWFQTFDPETKEYSELKLQYWSENVKAWRTVPRTVKWLNPGDKTTKTLGDL